MRNLARENRTLLHASVRALRPYLWPVIFISGFINLLALALPIYTLQVFDRVLSSQSIDTLAFLTLAAVIAITATSALDGVRNFFFGRLADWWTSLLAPEVLKRSLERRLADDQSRTDLLRELATLRSFLSGPGVPTLLDLPWLPIYLLVGFFIHPLLGLIGLLGIVLLLGMGLVNERLTHRDVVRASRLSAVSLRYGDSLVRNAEVIDTLGMAGPVTRRWSAGLLAELGLHERIQLRSAAVISSTRLVRALIQVALYGFAAMLVLNHEMTAGAMIAGSIITSRLMSPIEATLVHWRSLLVALQSYQRLTGFFNLPPMRTSQTSLPVPSGHLAVDRVSLLAPGMANPVLRNISFELQPGEHLAIIGAAASGKTTLVRTLVGLIKPQSGIVRLDSADVFTWRRDEFGGHVGYLPQDIELLSGTVAENIARFQSAADASVVSAAKLAGCHDMILSLPAGYETEIGEGGTRLSGGQRQQVALARALFGRPRFVVLDEPNSNLDVRGEQALRIALTRLRKAGVTTIIVTHRQSVITQMDKLLVLEAGAVKAFGPPAEVLAALRSEEELQRKRLAPASSRLPVHRDEVAADVDEPAAPQTSENVA